MIETIAPPVQLEIERRLAAIEREESIRYLVAVESGSRAWGFPSPDSDYDVRFIYVRPRDWYLALDRRRDVIEQPILDEIHLNGWDVRKALGLLLKSNAIVSEWINSPIRYRPDDPAVERLVELADALFNPRAIAEHYSWLGMTHTDKWLDVEGPVPGKKYFYSLRPALAICALRVNPQHRPPMNLQELVAAADLPGSIAALIEELVEAKRQTREKSNGRRFPELDTLMRSELSRARELPMRKPQFDTVNAVNELFLSILQ